MADELKSFHFDVGDSTKGPIGLCARVWAKDEAEAVEILKAATPGEVELKTFCTEEQKPRVEYLNVYINPNAFSVKDIDDVSEEEGDDGEHEAAGSADDSG